MQKNQLIIMLCLIEMYVANKVNAFHYFARCNAQAHASDKPSNVLVPRPISSINTKLFSVALCKMFAVSVISTIKVERPDAKSSELPIRVKMRSIGPITADAAGA